MATNKIGVYEFIELVRPADIHDEDVEIITRPGVDGIILRRLGKRGKPFDLISREDVASLTAGRQGISAYKDMIGGDAVVVIQNGVTLAPDYFVVAVRPLRLRAIATATGGLNPPSNAWLECAWTLVAQDAAP